MNQEEKQQLLAQWVEQYSDQLLRRALYLLSNREDALDLVQEVFLTACNAVEQYRGASASSYLYQILNHKVADFYRSKYKQHEQVQVDLSSYYDEDGNWLENLGQEWSDDEGELFDNSEFTHTFAHCLEHLPPKWATVVKLYYLQEHDAKSVCQDLQITTANLWKLLQRSRLQLRDCLEHNWFGKATR